MNVLVVDDKKIIRDFFDFTLGFYGHDITVVHDPAEVIDAVRAKHFDIAFLDILMPEKDGVQVLKEIKEVAPDLPIVMMSGYSLEEQQQQAKALGAFTCLKKPFELEDIRRVFKEATGKDI